MIGPLVQLPSALASTHAHPRRSAVTLRATPTNVLLGRYWPVTVAWAGADRKKAGAAWAQEEEPGRRTGQDGARISVFNCPERGGGGGT